MSASTHIDIEAIQADLAERFWVPCPGCTSGNCPNAAWYLRTGDVMVGCQGSGRRYPFRLPCPDCNGTGNMIGQEGYFVPRLTADP